MAVNSSENWVFAGEITFRLAPTLPAGSVGDGQASTVSPFGVNKSRHLHVKQLAQVRGSSVSAERRPIHVARAAGNLTDFRVQVTATATGDSTATVDLYKNNASVLTAPVTVDNGTTQFTIPEIASVASAAYVAGDVFEVVVTISAGSGTPAQGLIAEATFDEGAA